MITKINEGDYGLDIELTPETVEETAMLLRYSQNCNSEKPQVYFSFRKLPYLSIWLKKKKPSVQVYSLKASNKS